MRRLRWLVPVLLALSASGGTLALAEPGDLAAQRAELEAIEAELEAARSRASELAGQERKLGRRTGKLANEIKATARVIRRLDNRRKALDRRLARTKSRLAHTTRDFKRWLGSYVDGLRTLYRRVRVYARDAMAGPVEYQRAARGRRYLIAIAAQDRAALEGTRNRLAALKRDSRSLTRERRRTAKAVKVKAVTRSRLKRDHQVTRQELASVASERALSEASLEELESARAEAEARLMEYIAGFQRDERASRRRPDLHLAPPPEGYGTFAQRRGRLAWPAFGQVIGRFGRTRDPESGTWTFNRGVDLAVAPGTSVRAIGPGHVILRNWFRGYGSFVLIHHGAGYFTLYAGLSRVLVAEGDAVEGGAPIGVCDDMLHVEVLHDQEPLDPVSWLGAAR